MSSTFNRCHTHLFPPPQSHEDAAVPPPCAAASSLAQYSSRWNHLVAMRYARHPSPPLDLTATPTIVRHIAPMPYSPQHQLSLGMFAGFWSVLHRHHDLPSAADDLIPVRRGVRIQLQLTRDELNSLDLFPMKEMCTWAKQKKTWDTSYGESVWE